MSGAKECCCCMLTYTQLHWGGFLNVCPQGPSILWFHRHCPVSDVWSLSWWIFSGLPVNTVWNLWLFDHTWMTGLLQWNLTLSLRGPLGPVLGRALVGSYEGLRRSSTLFVRSYFEQTGKGVPLWVWFISRHLRSHAPMEKRYVLPQLAMLWSRRQSNDFLIKETKQNRHFIFINCWASAHLKWPF